MHTSAAVRRRYVGNSVYRSSSHYHIRCAGERQHSQYHKHHGCGIKFTATASARLLRIRVRLIITQLSNQGISCKIILIGWILFGKRKQEQEIAAVGAQGPASSLFWPSTMSYLGDIPQPENGYYVLITGANRYIVHANVAS